MPRDLISLIGKQPLENFDYFSLTNFGLATAASRVPLHIAHCPIFNMSHEVLAGGSCYTASEAQKLLDRINKQSTVQIQSIQGNWLYYVDLKKGQTGLDKVQQLLQVPNVSNTAPSPTTDNAVSVYITPRTISPWSSKATSIAHVCGLKDQVHRIERGRVITIEFKGPSGELADLPFRDIIHDRMTETITPEQPSLDGMFVEGERAPLVVVDIFAAGQESLSILQEYNHKMGLALSPEEMQYLVEVYTKLGRPPHDVELFMFAQVNSEYVFRDNRSISAFCYGGQVSSRLCAVGFFFLIQHLTLGLPQTLSAQSLQCGLDHRRQAYGQESV